LGLPLTRGINEVTVEVESLVITGTPENISIFMSEMVKMNQKGS
jgi:hypothetical protein